jgi:cyanophycinase-like exopeptidase
MQQPIYLFAGGRGKSILTSFAEIGQAIKSSGKKIPDVAIVGAASLKDNWLVYILMTALIKTGCKCRTHRVKTAHPGDNMEKARELLQKADVIFFSGGDAEAGMQILKDKNMVRFFRELATQEKILIGASAGTIMLSREWVCWKDPDNDATAELFQCTGIADVICDTHAEADDWVELKAALQLKENGATGYGIPSGACLKVYPDGRLEAKGGDVARYTKANGKIERRDDLLPG